MNTLRHVDLVVLLLYLAGVFALGCWFSKKSRKTEEFMAAGRSLPGWAVGLSIFGTYVSSIGFLANTGKAYGGDWNSWVFGLSLPVAAIIAVRFFVPLYRKEGNISAYFHLEQRFGPWARTFALVCYVLTQVARTGIILYLVALALSPLTGWSVTTIILVTGLMVTAYTLLGGIEAVIWTDAVQSVILVAGALFCGYLLITGMPGGPGQLFEIAGEYHKFSLGSFDLRPSTLVAPQPTFWIVLLFGIFINLQNFGINQSFVQRYITARSDRDAKFSVWLGALLFLPVSAMFFFIGTSLFSYYQADAELLDDLKTRAATEQLAKEGIGEPAPDTVAERAAQLTDAQIGDKVLPHFIVNKLPLGIAGLLIAAIFAAAMSSVDTSLNSCATLYLCDIHKRYFRPDASEKQSMAVLYTATAVVGVLGTATALAMIRDRSALDSWWIFEGMFTGGMLGLFLLGMISRRARKPHAVLAVVAGVLLILWLSFSTTPVWISWFGEGTANPFHKLLTVTFGTSTIVLVGILASRLFAKAAPRG